MKAFFRKKAQNSPSSRNSTEKRDFPVPERSPALLGTLRVCASGNRALPGTLCLPERSPHYFRGGLVFRMTRIFAICGEALPFAPLNTSFAVPSAATASAGIGIVFSTL